MTPSDQHRAALEQMLLLACEAEALAQAQRGAAEEALGRQRTIGALIRAKMAAFDWGVSEDTVLRWAKERKIRGVKTIGGWFVQGERPVLVDAEIAGRTASRSRARSRS